MPEKHELAIQTAKKEIELADHLLYVTFPTVNNMKFLVSITEHIIKSVKLALEGQLEFERLNRTIEPFPYNFTTEIEVFRESVMGKRGFDITHFHLLKKLAQVDKCDKESIMQFRRNDRYFLTTQERDYETLDVETVKKYLKFGKQFLSKVEEGTKSAPKKEDTYGQ